MNEYIAELIGTALLILLGGGVVANSVLKDTKGNGGGWLLISFGWGFGVFVGVSVAGPVSGAHLNPAVTFGLAVAGLFPWKEVLPFVTAQFLGAMGGAIVVWIFYRNHFDRTDDPGLKLGVFSTIPQIRNRFNNFFSEVVGTLVLVFVILYIHEPSLELPGIEEAKIGLGTLGALPVAILVTVIGISLGGTTGYAINPARDLGPRIIHSILPIRDKGSSDWTYSWIPFFGPLLGATLAAFLYILHSSIFA